MKKLYLVAVLVIAMMFTLTGCGKSDYQIYSEASDNMSNLESIDMACNAEIEVSDETTTVKIPVECNIKYDSTSKNAYFNIKASNSKIGNVDVTMYVLGDYIYVTMPYEIDGDTAETMKIKMKKDNIGDMLGGLGVQLPEINTDVEFEDNLFAEDDFKDVKKEKLESGDYKYTVVKTAEELKAYIQKIMEASMTSSEATDEEKDAVTAQLKEMFELVTFGDMTFSYVIKDGYFTQMYVALSVEGKADDDADPSNISIKADVKYNNPGEDVTVTSPSDLDEYFDISGDNMP